MLQERYLRRDESGSLVENPDGMLQRVARAIAEPFPAFQGSVWPKRGYSALRNATVTCVAPTGTISLLAGASSSIEPFFALALGHRVLDGRVLIEANLLVQAELARC